MTTPFEELDAQLRRKLEVFRQPGTVLYLVGTLDIIDALPKALLASAEPTTPRDRTKCKCGGVMFGDGFAHTSTCPAYEGAAEPTLEVEELHAENQRLRDGLQYLGEAVNPIAEARNAAWRRVAELEALIKLVKASCNAHDERAIAKALTKAVDASMDAAEMLAGNHQPAAEPTTAIKEQIEKLPRYRVEAYIHHSDAGQMPDARMVRHRYGPWLSQSDVLALIDETTRPQQEIPRDLSRVERQPLTESRDLSRRAPEDVRTIAPEKR